MPRHRFGFMGSESETCEPNQTRASFISSVRARQSQKIKKKKQIDPIRAHGVGDLDSCSPFKTGCCKYMIKEPLIGQNKRRASNVKLID